MKPGIKKHLRLAALALATFSVASLKAAPVLDTISGGPTAAHPSSSFGFVNGNTLTTAQYHTPWALALDSSATQLFVADRDNNAIRRIDLPNNWTSTFVSGLNKPVGVAVDGEGNVYVLNQGNGSNGSVLKYDPFGILLGTMSAGLSAASGIALDVNTNVYVTINNNAVMKIPPVGAVTTVATIPDAGTALRGITVMESGLIAVCDAGRHGILVVDPRKAPDISFTNLTGFNGVGDQIGTKANAKFRAPSGISKTGGNLLVVADFNNHHVKVVNALGTVTNLYGVKSNLWVTGSGTFPGWRDGTVCANDAAYCPEARQPIGLAFAPDGTVYSSETYYHIIRKTTGTSLPPPPPPPTPVSNPKIGWVQMVKDQFGDAVTSLQTGTAFVFNNDTTIAILTEDATETHYTFGPTSDLLSIPDPSPTVGGNPPEYENGWQSPPNTLSLGNLSDVTVKAISFQEGRPSSQIVMARFQFKTATPVVLGNNPASFVVTNSTAGATMWYTTDGTPPSQGFPSLGPITPGTVLSLDGNTNFTFKIQGFRQSYQNSAVSTKEFNVTNFLPNRITFGLSNSEPSSAFIARPGQFYYAPVTLQLPPEGERMLSLQFNISVTNGLTAPPVAPGAGIDFFSMLLSTTAKERADHFPPNDGGSYLTLPPLLFTVNPTNAVVTGFTNSLFVNPVNNLLGIGWLFRTGFKYEASENGRYILDFNTSSHDLISFSSAHDTLFRKEAGVVIVGAYSFQVPDSAQPGDKYFMQLGSPSATRSGAGEPGSSVYIRPPATPTAVTVGSPSYIAGDAAPFHWLNAGDFGEGMLLNDDVMQCFQSAITMVDVPPRNSDLFASLDSCGDRFGSESGGIFFPGGGMTADQMQQMFDGSDFLINEIPFGDKQLDVTDVYVTFRRSLDPSLNWFRRFWTNGVLAAEIAPNLAFNSNSASASPSMLSMKKNSTGPTTYQKSSVTFTAGDAVVTPGQTIQVPITAKILGNFPLKVLGLNLQVVPLDGSPALLQQVTFTPSPALGQPTLPAVQKNLGNYSAAWLNSQITGVSGDVTIGTLTIRIPGSASASASYAIHFDHASGSPNGVASFKKTAKTGLLTLSNRSASSWNDGISDSWRLRYFGTINNVLSAATADADGDTANNKAEFTAGTDPNDKESVLRMNTQVTAPGYTVRWPSVAGKTYVIERSTALFSGVWTPITSVVGTGGDMEFTDSSAAGEVRFYRVKVQ